MIFVFLKRVRKNINLYTVIFVENVFVFKIILHFSLVSGVPEVQRLVDAKAEVIKVPSENALSDEEFQKNSKYLIAFVNKNFKGKILIFSKPSFNSKLLLDICGIVTNSTMELPSSFCEILTKDHNVTRCMPLQDKINPSKKYETIICNIKN